jgi:hypothetical protein
MTSTAVATAAAPSKSRHTTLQCTGCCAAPSSAYSKVGVTAHTWHAAASCAALHWCTVALLHSCQPTSPCQRIACLLRMRFLSPVVSWLLQPPRTWPSASKPAVAARRTTLLSHSNTQRITAALCLAVCSLPLRRRPRCPHATKPALRIALSCY